MARIYFLNSRSIQTPAEMPVVDYGEESLEVLELEVLRSITYVISSFFLEWGGAG